MSRPKRIIYWTARARADLTAIGDYIAQDDPAAAERWMLKLVGAAEKAATFPLAGRLVPEVGRADLREVLLRSYRLVYRVTAARVEIVTVFEGHRALSLGPDVPKDE